jgi:N-ethylmaleimide reductase
MAPLTRCRAQEDHIATDLMATYYSQRTSAGLIVAEATMAMEGNSAFYREPGIYSADHAKAWKKVTDSVHKKSGLIFLQIWHGGRACHPNLNHGKIPIAPSAIAIEGEVHTPGGKVAHVQPRALEDHEIPGIIEGFRKAALYAKDAGFDGVEVHGANGYLLDAFLRDGSNQRIGAYGGSLENRARLLLDCVRASIDVWGSGRVGVRISPLNSYNSMKDSDPVGLTRYVAGKLSELKIAYLHLMRGDFFGLQKGDVLKAAREAFSGSLIGNMGYSPKEADESISGKLMDAVAFGHHYVSNPDLVERIAKNQALIEPDQNTFYTHEAKGYIDYPLGI